MNYRDMEDSIHGAKVALDAADSPEKVVPLTLTAIAHSLIVLAECAYRREIREGL